MFVEYSTRPPTPGSAVPGDTPGHELTDDANIDRRARTPNDERLGNLTGFVIGHANHRTISDVRMLEQRRFELCGGDAEALYLIISFLRSTMNTYSLVVDPSNVTSVEPSVAKHSERFLQARSNSRSSPAGRARESRRARPADGSLSRVEVDDAMFSVRDWHASASILMRSRSSGLK